MPVSVSADACQVSRLIPDTPAHEGDKRDGAKVQSGPGGNRGRSDGDRGGWGLGCPSANAAPFWLARYEGDGLEGLSNRSHRPAHCPHQTSPAIEAMVLEMRRAHVARLV